MLDLIRRKKKSGIIKLVFWAIIATFVGTIFLVWGKGSDQNVASNSAAVTVGEAEISFAEFQNVYSNLYNLYSSIYREQFTPEMEKRLNLRQQALDSLIDQTLLAQEARRRGIRVSDQEIVEAISRTPAFQSNGVFDKNLYVQVLNYQRITPEQYEASQRRSILIEKIQQEIQQGVEITAQEVETEFRRENESINLNYLRFSPGVTAAQVEINDDELKGYFEQNIENFRLPEKVALRYLQFEPARYLDQVQLDKSELERYYRRNLIQFEVPEQVGASHILVKVPEDISDEEKALKQAHAEKILSELREGKDFAELAIQYSDDAASASEGGRLPDFTRGTMVPAFEEVAFTLSPGEISDIVETPFGFHIIKVETYVEAGVKPLAEVMDAVKEGLRREKAAQLAMEKAMDAYNMNRKGGSLEAAAEANDLGIKETGLFARNGAIDGLPEVPEIKDVAFTLEEGELARPVETEAGVVLMSLKERRESRLPELADVRPAVVEAYRESRADELAEEAAQKALKRIRETSGTITPELAESFDVEVEETGFFTRSYGDFVPRIGASGELFDRAFELEEEGAVLDEVFSVGTDYFIVALQAQEAADMEKLTDSRREEIRNRLQTAREEEALQEALDAMREKTDISIQPVMTNYLL